ncbi:MAG: class IV adenylate cyclase [Sedimentisphaerales bacterium]|jgi:adenylate cyclase class 2
MHIEIEAKLKVDSFKGIEKRLKALDAEFLRERLHTDAYFDDAKLSLRKADSALRLRHQLIGRRDQIVITFKGPRREGRFKQRQEIQFEVSDARLAEMFLGAIGYKKMIVYQKKRRVWHYGECEVALDELPLLGRFVEIEGPGEKKIAAVQKKLGLEDLPHIHQSYAALMQKQIRRRGRKNNRVFF